jgi:3-hydroxypropanoate dehydrogenase
MVLQRKLPMHGQLTPGLLKLNGSIFKCAGTMGVSVAQRFLRTGKAIRRAIMQKYGQPNDYTGALQYEWEREGLGLEAAMRLFDYSRTANDWLPSEICDADITAIYDRLKWGPTSANLCPGRFVFLRSADAKARLKPYLFDNNQDRMDGAACSVIVARDTRFYEFVGKTFPGREMVGAYMKDNPQDGRDTAIRNATLQGAYLIIAARMLGWDTNPMSGFDNAAVDAEFFPDGRWQSDFLVNIGRCDFNALWPRNPRLSFDDACRLL